MEKLKMQTENLVNTNIDKIANLFPNCISEGTDSNGKVVKMVDFDLLKQELSDIVVEDIQCLGQEKNKRYLLQILQ